MVEHVKKIEHLISSTKLESQQHLLLEMGIELSSAMGLSGAVPRKPEEETEQAERWLHAFGPTICQKVRESKSLSALAAPTPGVFTIGAVIALSKELVASFGLPSAAVTGVGIVFSSIMIIKWGFTWFEEKYGRHDS